MTTVAAGAPPRVAEFGFYPFSRFLREVFPWKVYKVTIDAGFTCPNRDGTCGVGGCTYCINESFSPNTKRRDLPVRKQMENGMAVMRGRFGAQKFIAYFQAFSNTYAPVDRLKELYGQAVTMDDVVGLAVGTRPDCVDSEKLELLESYAERLLVFVEYGLQSMHDATLDKINRGHGYRAFSDAVVETARRKLKTCVHVILGLPGETHEMMMATAQAVAALPIDSIKIHHLYIAEGTEMARQYARGKVKVLSAEDYVRLACDFLERISPEVSVQRLVGELTSNILVAPRWGLPKQQVFARITKEFRRRGSYQGCRFAG